MSQDTAYRKPALALLIPRVVLKPTIGILTATREEPRVRIYETSTVDYGETSSRERYFTRDPDRLTHLRGKQPRMGNPYGDSVFAPVHRTRTYPEVNREKQKRVAPPEAPITIVPRKIRVEVIAVCAKRNPHGSPRDDGISPDRGSPISSLARGKSDIETKDPTGYVHLRVYGKGC